MVGRSPKVYNVNINEDITMFERIENAVHMLNSNYNRYCPFCIGCNFKKFIYETYQHF